MIDINEMARRYSNSNPYEFVRIREPDHKEQVRYRLRITEQPDPVLALMVGDFVHNLRSALDHVIFACVPRAKRSNATGFPIAYKDIFAEDANGEFVVKDDDARASFERQINGVDARTRALIIDAQPYHFGAEAHRQTLGIISRLDNADKHRALTAIGTGVKDLAADVTAGDNTIRLARSLEPHAFVEDRTIVGWTLAGHIAPSKVNMKYSATTVVHIKVSGVRGNERPGDFPLRITMLMVIRDVRRWLRVFERFVLS